MGLTPQPTLAAVNWPIENCENKIVLAHYPDRAKEAANWGAKLFLAGHTHGGQFWLWSWFLHLCHRYAPGHYRLGATHIYVNRGFGFLGYPGRVGILPEITVVELKCA